MAKTDMIIEVIPFGQIDNSLLDYLKDNLNDIFAAEIIIKESETSPEYAFNSQRDQYYSAAILNNLLTTKKEKNRKTLAIIDKDLYVPELNFVFGQADPRNAICIISITRLKPSYYGLSEDDDLFFKRSLKEAVHELGHLLDLGHCQNPKCVMYFSNSLSDTDRKDYRFCDKCRIFCLKKLIKTYAQ